jgi:hypothetical protein
MPAPAQPCGKHASCPHQHSHAGTTPQASTSTSMQEKHLMPAPAQPCRKHTSCQHQQHSRAGNTRRAKWGLNRQQPGVTDACNSLCCGRNMLRAHTRPRRQPVLLPTHLCTTHPVTLTFSCCTSFFQTALGCGGSSKSLFSRFCTLHTAMRAAALPGCLVLQSCRCRCLGTDTCDHGWTALQRVTVMC